MPPRETGPRRETSKQRTGRIRLDYYKTLDPLSRFKGWLAVAAALASVAWLSGLGLDPRQWSRRAERAHSLVNPGALARAHATWDAECQACHVAFKPIDGSGWSSRFVPDARVADARCRSCHAAPDHHAATASGEFSCASCHREHRGREASLVVMDDRNCTRCHAALGSTGAHGRAPRVAASVPGFNAHPEFALFRQGPPKDPGRVKFNHALHMTRGLTLEPGGRPLKTAADLAPEDRARYREAGSNDDHQGIQLRCDSCHRPDGARASSALLMKPIRFETDCRACHPLDFDPDRPALRHAIQPDEVVDALWQAYSAEFVKDHPRLGVPRPVPGHEDRSDFRAAREAIGVKVAKAETVVFGGKRCGECHEFEKEDAREVGKSDTPDDWRHVRVAPVNVNDVWFRNAAFDHSAHSAVGCRDCHARAYADDRDASRTSGDVLLPTIAVCRTCHAPREKTADSVTGGAGFGCAECHRYHGDAAPSAGAKVDAGLKQFLLGVKRGLP